MATSQDGINFSRSIGGYDAADVARAIAETQEVLKSADALFRKADNEVRRLEQKLHERHTSSTQFSGLGSAFESAIHLAEEQATKLVSDAQTETAAQVAAATAASKDRSKAAQLASRNALAAARQQAEKIRARSEQDAAQQRHAIQEKFARVAEERAQVDRVVAAVLADAESQIAGLRTRVNEEIERDLAAANEELRRATKIGAKIDAETLALEEKASREISAIIEAAEKYAAQTKTEAQAHIEQSHARANDVALETEKYVAETQARAAKALDEARARSEQALMNAEKITGEITAASHDFVASMTRDLEERLDKARRNLDDISGFLYTVRSLANGFDLGDLSVARSRVTSDRANNTASVAELIED
jgi:chromosome segregation ATPase